MASTTRIKSALNGLLKPLRLRLESTVHEVSESERINRLAARGIFIGPQFPIPPCMQHNESAWVIEALPRYRDQLMRLVSAETNDVGFTFANPFYCSPDADILYTLIRECSPGTVIEVGCGNSTQLMRQAITDGNLPTKIISIDPQPRREIAGYADEIIRDRVESCNPEDLASRLKRGDILFIDSSHCLSTGNDVAVLFLNVLPRLEAGVIVHVHDIFLPYEYPENWVRGAIGPWNWDEQYLLQAILTFGDAFDVIWPGYYLQQTMGEAFLRMFPFATTPKHAAAPRAQSFWMRVSEQAARRCFA